MKRLLRVPAFLRIILLLLVAVSPSFAQTADFTASPASGCSPLTVQFSDMSTGVVTAYSWNLGNSVTSTLPNPSTTYSTPGTYTVTLTVTGPAGSDTKTATISAYDKPAVSFVAATPVAGCRPHDVQFTSTVTPNSPGAVTYNWVFGDGNTDTSANPFHTYTTPGTYTVSLTVTNGAGCSRTAVQNAYITAYPVPAGGFSATQTFFCNSPASAGFSNTTTGGTGLYATAWTFGDGGTGTGNSVSHTYNTGGNFTVTIIVTDAHGCADTVVKTAYITVVSTQPTFTAPTAVCQGVAGTFVNTTNGGSNTSWNFGDGNTTTAGTVTHAYATAGTYTVTMTTVIGGCTKTAAKSIVVNPKPAATIGMSPSIPCPAPVTVTFTGNSTYASNYAWHWNMGGTATGQTVGKNYTANIRDTVVLITTSAAGCLDTVMMDTVMIREIITVITTGPGLEAFHDCPPHLVLFNVELKGSLPRPPGSLYPPYPVDANSWSWDFGDGSMITSALPNPSHVFVDTGTFTVRCIITTHNGCRDTGYTYVHLDSPTHPSFTASPLTICPNGSVTFINTTAKHLPGTIYNWVFSDRHVPFTDSTILKYDTGRVVNKFEHPGSYSVILQTNHNGCLSDTGILDYITVNPPGANFTDSIYCAPSTTTIKFTNTSLGATSQLWNFGDGDTSTALSPIHTYPGTGIYSVKLIVHSSIYGCSDTITKIDHVFDPVMGFTASDTTVCRNEFVHFQAGSTAINPVTYSWRFDNVLTPFDTTSTLDHQFTTRGRYDVTLYAISGQGCLDSLRKPGYILVSQPAVNFGAYPPIGCQPLPVRFIDSTTNTPGVRDTLHLWVFGDGDTAINNLAVINKIYPATGSYTVRLIVTDSLGCTDSLLRYNYVSVHRPQAIFTTSARSICNHQQVQFTSGSGGTAPLRHYWDFGDGTTDTGYLAAHTYTVPGVYTIRLIVIDSVGCSDTLTRNNYITVNAPHAAFAMSDSMSICPPLLVRFTNQSTNAVSYLWDFGTGGSPVVVTSPVSIFNVTGVYTVKLIVTDIYGCTDTARNSVRVLGYNGAFAYTPTNGCAPMPVQFFTPLTGIPQLTWDFGDGVTTITTTTSTTHTYVFAGIYVPKVIFSDGHGCSSSSTGLDTIRADKITANFNWSVPCMGAAFSLSDSSTAVYNSPTAWTWYFGGGDTAVGLPVSYTFPTPGNHPVTLIATNATGCKDTITRDVFINYLPLIDVTDDTGVCPGDKVDLVARGGVSYTWSPAPDSIHNCPAVCDTAYVHLDSNRIAAVYWVTGTDANGCVNKDSVRVTIQLRTTSSVGDGGEICVGESFRLHAEGAQHYEWMPAATIDSPFIASPLATPQFTTTYIVAAKEGSCDIDSQHVRVLVHSLPLFSAGEDEIISLGSVVTLQPTRSGITRIEWRADTTLSCIDCFRPNAYPLYTTTYYATGYNEFGCRAMDSVTVHVRCNGSLVFIPNTFTPNGDGQNDYFFPRGKGIDRMTTFRVFNRWGELIFERSNVALNDERAGWDGTYEGRALPPDVYVYTMQSKCATGDPLSWKGDVTLMR